MGLTITSNYKDAISLDGGYSMLFKIRKIVAKAYDTEFGILYAKFLDNWIDMEDRSQTVQQLNDLLSDSRFKEEDHDILDFLFEDDEQGQISYKTCYKIYNLIKDDTGHYQLRYAFYSKNDWEDFKNLLLGCYSHKASLRWN